MSSRRLFWTLPVAAVLLCAMTVWERAQSRTRAKLPRPVASSELRLVGPPLQFELYDSENRTVRLSRYLGRHRIDLVFMAVGCLVRDDPAVAALLKRHDAGQGGGILLIVSPELPQAIRREDTRPESENVVFLSDVGGRRGQMPGGVADAWGVLDRKGQVPSTRWFAIDRAGRVAWSGSGPLARDVEDILPGGSATSGTETE